MEPPRLPVVDVVMTTYNSARTVERSIASLQRQSLRDIRIIVVDDASTDDTADIVARLAAGDPRIELVRQPVNRRIVGAANEGLSRCRASYVARQDFDDLSLPDRLETEVAYLEANPDCVAVSTYARQVDETGRFLGRLSRPAPPTEADPHWFPSREPYLMHPFLLARREALEAVGGYRHVFYAEDTDLYWRLREIGRLHTIPAVMGDYTIHAGSITGRSPLNGRVSAVNSQLSALSTRRREQGRPDLSFPAERLAEYEAAETVEEMLTVAGSQLAGEERDYLRLAVAAKLVEVAAYRPYFLAPADYSFVRSTITRNWRRLHRGNASVLRNELVSLGTKLLYNRRFRDLMTLLPASLVGSALGRVASYTLRHRLARLGVASA